MLNTGPCVYFCFLLLFCLFFVFFSVLVSTSLIQFYCFIARMADDVPNDVKDEVGDVSSFISFGSLFMLSRNVKWTIG